MHAIMQLVRTWNEIDWDQPRPSLQALIDSQQKIQWEPRLIESPPMERYLDQIRATHVNGGFLLGRWRATQYDDVTAWFAARNRLDEYEMHRLLFEHPTVRRDLVTLEIPPKLDRGGGFKEVPGGALNLDGILATIIVQGGAYREFQGPAAQAKQLADEAVADLTGRRYEDFRLDQSNTAWTPWFYDVAWDYTLVLTDYRNAEMTVLCITDTD